MRKTIFCAIVALILQTASAFGQCHEYIEAIAESELDPYILDGNFLAPVVTEGETVKLNRTFLEGQSYKLVVCGMDMFFKEITVTEAKKVIFKNFGKEARDKMVTTADGDMFPLEGITFFEFTPDHTMNLEIKVKIVPFDGGGSGKLEGCLGILVGFQK